MGWLDDKPDGVRAGPEGLVIDYRHPRDIELGPTAALFASVGTVATVTWFLRHALFDVLVASGVAYLVAASTIAAVWTARSRTVLTDHQIRWAMTGNVADGWGIRLKIGDPPTYVDLSIPPAKQVEARWLADWLSEQAQSAEPVPEPTAEDLVRARQVQDLLDR